MPIVMAKEKALITSFSGIGVCQQRHSSIRDCHFRLRRETAVVRPKALPLCRLTPGSENDLVVFALGIALTLFALVYKFVLENYYQQLVMDQSTLGESESEVSS